MTAVEGPTIQIGPARIGAGEPVYVVAEVGVNHDGQLDRARELIDAAVYAEADAVKFQTFSADRLVRRDAESTVYQRKAGQGISQYDMLERLALTDDAFEQLRHHAEDSGIEFLATPFSVQDVDLLVRLQARAIKLASPDIVNVPLLERIASSGLPIIASTGAATLEEVEAAVDYLRSHRSGPFALLHCVSSYPTFEYEANLAAIGTLASRFGCVVGFSDHTESLTIGALATAAGAGVIEKHLTLDSGLAGPDHGFSLEPDQMAAYVREIRRAEMVLGQGVVAPTESQMEVRRLARGSIVAARPIRAGQMLTRELLTIKRPADGIEPNRLGDLIGRQARIDIDPDTPIAWEALG
jgi:sialic acid synthase SpsE